MINVIYKDYDENNTFVIFKQNDKNIYFDFGLCGFENEMEYYDIPTKLCEFEGEKGFLFSNKIDKKDLEMEIKRFIKHNELGSI
jgi:hypothetical protein